MLVTVLKRVLLWGEGEDKSRGQEKRGRGRRRRGEKEEEEEEEKEEGEKEEKEKEGEGKEGLTDRCRRQIERLISDKFGSRVMEKIVEVRG